ncbi:MAG TPA: glycosyltransferase family 39 protein [Thermoleophilaceae bacterium]|jgi:hypothetical protein
MSVASPSRAHPLRGLALPRVRFRDAAIAVSALAVALRGLAMAAYAPAFLGYPDTSFYVAVANEGASEDPFRPGGYPVFLRAVHAFGITGTVLIQHVLGLATAMLLFLIVRRLGGSQWVALVPAAAVALCGSQVMIEHALLSEPLFAFLVAAALYACVRSLDDGIGWAVAAGMLLGAAVPVRLVALGLIPVAAIWLVLASPRRRLLVGLAFTVVAASIPAAWGAVNDFTRTGPYNFYGRVGPFADCHRFDPPSGTRMLCIKSPPDRRGSTYSFIFTGGSPAVAYFGHPQGYPEPTKDDVDRIRRFARAAAIGQPLDYVRTVAKDSFRYLAPEVWRPPPGDATQMPEELNQYFTSSGWTGTAVRRSRAYYGGGVHPTANEPLLEALRVYERGTRFTGLAFVLVLLPALAAPFLLRGRARAGALLLLLCGLALLAVPVATIFYDYRFAIPALGALATAGALGAGEIAGRVRARQDGAA